MLSFNDLTPAQRKWVSLVELTHPEVTDEITYQQIKDFHEEFLNLRAKGVHYKVGLALWLIGNNAVRRGVYFFPGSKNSVLPVGTKAVPASSSLADELTQELSAYGIK